MDLQNVIGIIDKIVQYISAFFIIVAIILTIALVMLIVKRYKTNSYIVRNKNKIQQKLDYCFKEGFVDKESQPEIISALDIRYYSDSLDYDINCTIVNNLYNKILINSKLKGYMFKYSKTKNKYELCDNDDKGKDKDKYDYSLEEALYDEKYKYRKELIKEILKVSKVIDEPFDMLEKTSKNYSISNKERTMRIDAIKKGICRALDKFHEIFLKIDEKYNKEIESEPYIFDDSILNDINNYMKKADRKISRYKKRIEMEKEYRGEADK